MTIAQTEVEVAYVNPPKGAAKKGSIKTVDGKYYGVWPDKLSLFVPGQKYIIEYETDMYQGKEYSTFKRFAAGSPQTNPNKAYTASVSAATAATYTKDEAMFVMAVMGKAYDGTGGVPDKATLTLQIKSLLHAWRDGMADKPITAKTMDDLRDPLDDAVPF